MARFKRQGKTESSLGPELKLSKARFWILFLSMSLAGVGLLWVASAVATVLLQGVLLALGTGLIVAAVFNVTQLLLTFNSSERVLAIQVASEVRKALDEAYAEQRLANTLYLPTHKFPASSQPLPDFHREFMTDLNRSSELLFRGVSARHTAARLHTRRDSDIDVVVLLPDIKIPESLDDRIDYMRRYEARGFSEDVIRDRVRHEVKTGLIGLFEVRSDYRSLTILLTSSPTLDRFEVMNNAVWITLFTDVTGSALPYPSAVRFDNDSLLYRMQRREITQLQHNPSIRKYSVTRATPDRQLL